MTDRAFPWQQRLPFAGLLGAAITGILLANFLPVDSTASLAGCGFFLLVWLIHRRAVWVYLAAGFAFAALQIWQTRESPAWMFAESLGGEKTVASVRGRVVGLSDGKPGAKARFLLEVEELEIHGQILRPACRIFVSAPADAPTWNDRVSASGTLCEFAGQRNPGQFDFRTYQARQGVTCELIVSTPADIRIEPDAGFSIPRLAAECRRWMEATLREGISGDPLVCELLAGLVLGATSEIPDTLQAQFRQTGTFHIFSVSGLHVGMIAVILWQLLRVFAVDRRACVLLIIPALFFYSLVTGWKPSSIRAATMTAIFLIGMVSSRQPVPLNSLCAAAFLILAQSTNELFNPGFQLSVTVVAAILLFSAPIQKLLRAALLPDSFIPSELWNPFQKARCTMAGITWGLIAVSLAAWIGSLPLTLWYFQLISFSALVANPVIVPLTFVIMSTALLALGCGVFSQFLAAVFNNANLALTHVMLGFIQSVASMPCSFITLGPPPRAPLEVVVFDLGAGGCAAIRSGGRLCLLDAGDAGDFKTIIQPWMRGIGKLAPDSVVLTHGDSQHISGAVPLAASHTHFYESPLQDRSPVRQKLQTELAAQSNRKSIVQAGDVITISDHATLQILHPPGSLLENKADDKAIIALLESHGTSILFLSDSGPAAWEILGPIRADIAVIGRHHSGILPDIGFLQKLGIRAVIASAAAFPQNEPIDENWAAALHENAIELFRMDETGAVQILAGPHGFELESFLGGRKFSPPR
ncbi:MAG: ComEC/Rec2 family competence protein [Spartobacteria bacterium]